MRNSAGHTPGVTERKRKGTNSCCLKCWLTLFILTTITLIGIIIWLSLKRNNIDAIIREQESNGEKGIAAADTRTKGSGDSMCLLPKLVGPCRAALPRVYFDSETKECKKFNYGGCKGNENNFESIEECERSCAVYLPKVANPATVCAQPPDSGPCDALIPRYHFDSAKGDCVQFTYGGCQGNQNNFETVEECRAICIGQGVPPMSVPDPIPSTANEICLLPRDIGPCQGSVRRYWYDYHKGVCDTFIYGGCQGNANNFETKTACEQQCVPRNLPEDMSICELAPDVGPCKNSVRRFFYDATKKECLPFNYGGCQGNGNNFETSEECLKKCKGG